MQVVGLDQSHPFTFTHLHALYTMDFVTIQVRFCRNLLLLVYWCLGIYFSKLHPWSFWRISLITIDRFDYRRDMLIFVVRGLIFWVFQHNKIDFCVCVLVLIVFSVFHSSHSLFGCEGAIFLGNLFGWVDGLRDILLVSASHFISS